MSSVETFTYIPDEVLLEIARIGELRSPLEACGVLLPLCLDHVPACQQVIELENEADGINQVTGDMDEAWGPNNCYKVDADVVVQTILERMVKHPELRPPLELSPDEAAEWVNLSYFLWHTHPSGLVGPSAGDMEFRVQGIRYLVVTLTPSHPPIAARF